MPRGLVVLAASSVLAGVLLAGPAAASPVGAVPGAVPAAVGSAPAPVTRCGLTDPRLDEVSGLVSTPAGSSVVNDSGNDTVVYTLAPDCTVAAARRVGVAGRDVEDLARSADGTLWLADIGDNGRRRATIALLGTPSRGAPTVLRLTYPDGPHDAEALLLPRDGRPVILTKELSGRSAIYTTDAAPAGLGPTPLRRVGEFVVPPSSTEGGPVSVLGPFGRGLVTGGALSADGRVAAVRTYTDAWLVRVDGDTADAVVAALRSKPVPVPLPGEAQGEAVAFTADGTLLSAGESGSSARPGPSGRPSGAAAVRAVPGAAELVGTAPDTAAAVPQAPVPAPRTSASEASEPGPDVVVGVVAVGAVLALAVACGVALTVAVRRRAGETDR